MYEAKLYAIDFRNETAAIFTTLQEVEDRLRAYFGGFQGGVLPAGQPAPVVYDMTNPQSAFIGLIFDDVEDLQV